MICEIWIEHRYEGLPDDAGWQKPACWIEAGTRLTGMMTPQLQAHLEKHFPQMTAEAK